MASVRGIGVDHLPELLDRYGDVHPEDCPFLNSEMPPT
jgi:hypothetical protein